ncbi:apolipophorins isoform X2 [Chrysoperla carnea]|uniref:apolipophorins isoform X2 n=1 Tax=Chrysoperla carnea TaxID=189513 RepID=UPI001D0914A9|nr:apolipophorins isoform X2 [Chrysoperla carnea]
MGTHKKRLSVSAIAIVLFVATSTYATDKCRTGCHGVTPHLFKYQEGTTYKYKLEGSTEITLNGADQQSTNTRISGNVLVTQLKDCQQLVRLDKIQVHGPNPTKYDLGTDLKKSVRIVFHDGHIEDEICTEPNDSQSSLNIKRAVISMLQAATKHKSEIDVFGSCPTSFNVHKEGSTTIIRKVRDLNSCAYREAFAQDFITSSFNPKSDIKSTPLLGSDYSSEQTIKDGILQNVLVTENYIFKPFSIGQNGAKAIVNTKLHFVGQSKENVKPKPTEPRQILFENPHIVNTPASNVNNLLSALNKALESSTAKQVISANAARDFAALVNTLRVTSKNDVLAAYGSVKAGAGVKEHKNAAKKLLLEALYRAGTGDSIEVAIELLLNKEIPVDQQRILYLSLSFVKHTTSASLLTASKILDQPNLPREAYLGVGTLAGRYCRDHKCENDHNLDQLTKKFISKIGNCKSSNRDNENTLISLLKGLRNFNRLSDSILDNLITCAKDKSIPPRVRVAALETFSADPSKAKLKKAALGILKNREEDSEIRIKAYLVLVQSPSGDIANALKDLLATEPVNQVGAFIVSHLRNIRSSTNPNKEAAKQHLSLLRSPKRYPIDVRRFSFNSELSYAIDTLGLAASMESNVIYSQDSWLPRSANINVTSEMFGSRINFMELSVRQENLDRLVEHYLGPRGVLQTSSTSDLLESSKKEIYTIMEKLKQRLEKTKRGRRDVSEAQLLSFAKAIKLGTTQVGSALDVDLSVKLFGSEVLFATLNNEIDRLTPEAIVDKIFDQIDSGIEKVKNFESVVGTHVQFLDVDIAYPTSTGFPIRLGAIGSGAVQLVTSTSVDIRKCLSDPKNAHVAIKLIPSANIEIVGTLVSDAYAVESGLSVSSSLHTATGSDLNVQLLNNGKGIDVKLGLPIEKQDVLTISHDIVYATRELGHQTVEVPIKFTGQRKEYRGCFDQLSSLIGLTFCADIGVPVNSLPGVPLGGVNTGASPFPLSGPAKVSVQIQRDDSKDYHFRANYIDNQPDRRKLELSFDTPNSKVNRRINLVVEGGVQPDKYIKATLISPIKTATLEGRIINTNQEISANAKLAYDNQEYSGKIGAKVSGNDASSRYTPLIQFKTPQKGSDDVNGYKVDGVIIVEKSANGKKLKLENVRLISPVGSPIGVSGHLAKDGPKYEVDLTVSQDKQKGSVKAALVFVSPENVKLSAEVQNSLNPHLNLHIAAEHKRSAGQFENKFEVVHGQDLSASKNKFKLENSAKYNIESYKKYDVQTNNQIEYPLLNILLKANVHVTCHSLDYDVAASYEKFKAESQLKAHINKKQQGDYYFDLKAEALQNKFKLLSTRDVVGPSKSKFNNEMQIQNRKYSLKADVVHQLKANDINAQLDATVEAEETANPLFIKQGLVYNPKVIEAHSTIKDGETKLMDAQFTTNRAGNANGALKINLRNILAADGSLVVKDGKGTADITVDLKKINRKVKGDASFHVAKPVYNANVNLLLNAEKDPSQKISISTQNKITENSINSKNKVDVLGQVLEANVDGNIHGKINNGLVTGKFDVTLPTGQYLAGKLNRQLSIVQNVVNGQIGAELEVRLKKQDKGHKLVATAVVKDTNYADHIVDLSGSLNAIKNDGQNVQINGGIKHSHAGDKHKSSGLVQVGGSLIKYPSEGTFSAEYGKNYGKYVTDFVSKVGASFKAVGQYDLGHSTENKFGYNVQASVKTPNEKYNELTVESTSTMTWAAGDSESSELTTSNALGVNNKVVKLDGSVRGNKDLGSGKVSVLLTDGSPVTISANYKRAGLESCQIGVDIEQDGKDGKKVKVGLNINKPDHNQIVIKMNALTPVEKARNVDLSINLKRSSDNKNLHTDISLSSNGKKYGLVNDVLVSETSPSFDLKLTYPENQNSQVFAKFNRVNDQRFSGELNILNIKDFSLESSGEANLESVENFHIKLNVNSKKMNLENVKVEILNKPTKSGKRLQFSAKSGNTNLLSGSTSLESKEEAGKLIVSGSGEVQVKDNKKKASFKLIRKNLDGTKDDEKGLEITLDGSLGSKKVVGELILSNKQLHLRKQYCEDNHDCAHIDVTSKIQAKDVKEYHHTLSVSVDLRKFGLKNEFGMKSEYARKELDIQHVIDLYFQEKEKIAYQYKFTINPKNAVLQLTLPKRVISIEGVLDVNIKQAPKHSTSKVELAVYLDKVRQPKQRLLLSASSNVHVDEQKSAAVSGEIKLSHPALEKDLILSGNANVNKETRTATYNVDIDVFAKKQQKVTIKGTVTGTPIGEKGYNVTSEILIDSKGSNIHASILDHFAVSTNGISAGHKATYTDAKHKREAVFLLVANKEQFELVAQIPYVQPLHISSKLQVTKKSLVAHSSIDICGVKHIIQELEIKDFNMIHVTQYSKESPSEKLSGAIGLIPGQLAEIRADVVKGGKKHNLFLATLHLDDAHFLATDTNADIEAIKKYADSMRKEVGDVFDELKKVATKMQQDNKLELDHIKEQVKKVLPNLKPIVDQYKKQLHELREEIVSDKTLKEIEELIKNTFGPTLAAISELLNNIAAVLQKFEDALTEAIENIYQVFKTKIIPQLQDIAEKFEDLVHEAAKSLADLIFLYIAKVSEIIKAHEADFKKLATSISEIGRELGLTIAKALSQIKEELTNFINALVEQIKALPVTDIIKEKYAELTGSLNLGEDILEVLNEFVNTIKGVLPTPEFQEVVQMTYDYIAKKLKKEQVDDAASLKQIYHALERAVKSILKLLQAEGSAEALQNLMNTNIPLSFGALTKIPTMISIQLSPLRYIFSDDLPSLSEIIYSYRPRFNPIDNLPPFKLNAMIVDGQHIFTFDQRHITLPGKCNYLLARDALDGNFTITAELQNGELKSITLSDKSGSLTVKKDGTLVKNNVPTEYPAETETLAGWRRYSSINLKSKFGVTLKISPNLRIIVVDVSGFYRNRIRGILGNPNDEEYDDFVLPSGKIAKSESEFANAYKLGSCPDVKVQEHAASHNSPVCSSLFSSESSLRHCFPVINPNNFRAACEHAVAAGSQDSACWLASGYTYACQDAGLPAKIPSSCVKCDLGDGKKLNFGETGTVQSPKGKADIVLLIEQLKVNEALLKDLIIPTMQQLKSDLKARGISDVHFALVGYGGQKWPAHFTNGGKIEYQGQPTTIKFVEKEDKKLIEFGIHPKIDAVLFELQILADAVKRDLGLNSANMAAWEVAEYPFRPDAARSVIVIQAQNCYAHRTRFGLSTLAQIYMQEKYRWNGATFNLITPLDDLEVEDSKQAKSVIGFNRNGAFTYADAKKKTVEGNAKLKDELEYPADSCIDFAQRSSGAVFSSSAFKECKGGQKKQYIQVVSKVITEQLAGVEYTRDCVCGLTDGIIPKTYCVVSSKHGQNTPSSA